ncbi:MAG: WhiB family transcriptional regulator [Actinobacteria bacterium]|nr:WhiB family transcriptional regulator [Actinomycetota bacterium]
MTRYPIAEAGFAVSSIWFSAEPPGSWTERAACRRYPGFAECFTEATTLAEADLALTLCDGCAVRAACLRYGQVLEADGVWGGRLLRHGRLQ